MQCGGGGAEDNLRCSSSHITLFKSETRPAVAYAMLADLQASGGSNGSSHCSGNAGITKTSSVGSWDSERHAFTASALLMSHLFSSLPCFCFYLSE